MKRLFFNARIAREILARIAREILAPIAREILARIARGYFMKKTLKEKPKKLFPSCWTLGWSGQIELGFEDGTYLPRKTALLLFPEYFTYSGCPIYEKLPFDTKL